MDLLPSVNNRRLEMTPAIARQAMRIIIRDRQFAMKWRGRLESQHFDEPHLQTIFMVVNAYLEKFNALPTLEMLFQCVKDAITTHDNADGFMSYIQGLFNEPDREHDDQVKLILMDHMRANDYDRFAITAAHMVAEGKYDEIEPLLKKLAVRHSPTKPVEAYMLGAGDSVSDRVAREGNLKVALQSPWPTFNTRHGHGFHAGTVSAFMGSTGSGKSLMLINCGCSLLLQGKNVYHFTFELSADKTKARYDVCLTGCSQAERKSNPKILDAAIAKFQSMNMGKLYVIERPTGTVTTNMVLAEINDHIMLGAPPPDVVILDYLTIMMPNKVDQVDMKKDYAKNKVIAEEVRAMAMSMQIPIITALQSNRGAAGKEKQSKEDIADSYAVMHVLDMVMSINQNDQEKQACVMRGYMAKVRDFADGYVITFDANYNNLRITENTVTTANYNAAIAKQTAAAMAKSGGTAPLPSATISQEDPDAGINGVLGMSLNPVKQKNNAVVDLSNADHAAAKAWGEGSLQPPPIAAP